MGIAVRSATTIPVIDSTSVTATIDRPTGSAAPQPGDLLLIIAARSPTTQSITAFSSSSGGTWASRGFAAGASTVGPIGVLTRTATASEPASYTVTATNPPPDTDQWSLHLLVVSGVDTTTPIAAAMATTTGSAPASAVAAPARTVPSGLPDAALLITSYVGERYRNTTPDTYGWSTPSGMTEVADRGGVWLYHATDVQLVPAGDTGTRQSRFVDRQASNAAISTQSPNVPRAIALVLAPAQTSVTHPGAATLTDSASLLAGPTQDRVAAATLTAGSDLQASATRTRPAAATLPAGGDLTAAATRVRPAAATLTAAADLTAVTGTLAAATLPAGSDVTAAPRQDRAAAATLPAGSDVTAAARQDLLVAADLTSAATVTADPVRVRPAAATLGSGTTLAADATRVRPAAADLRSGSSLSADTVRTRPAAAILGAGSGLQVTAQVRAAGVVDPQAWIVHPLTGRLHALPHLVRLVTSPVLSGVGSIQLDYPAWGRHAEILRQYIHDESDLEVETWLCGYRRNPRRWILHTSQSDDLDQAAVIPYSGGSLEILLGEAPIGPQEGTERREVRFAVATVGEILIEVLRRVQADGYLVGVLPDFTATRDSAGQLWPDRRSPNYDPKATVLDVAQDVVEKGWADAFRLTASRVLQAYRPGGFGTDRTLGPRSQQMVWRGGQHVDSAPRRHTTAKAGTDVLVSGKDGRYAKAGDPTARAKRRRKIGITGSAGNLDDDGSLIAYAQTLASTVTHGETEISHSLVFGDGDPRPDDDYAEGDWVWSDTDGGMKRLRIYQQSVIAEVGKIRGDAVLNTLRTDAVLAVLRRLNGLVSGVENAGTSNPPAGPDQLPPSAPTGLNVGSVARKLADGGTEASILASWTHDGKNVDGSQADDLRGYRIEVRDVAAPADAWSTVREVDDASKTSADVSGFTPGRRIHVRVLAGDATGNWSDPSNVVEVLLDTDRTGPPRPSAPTVSATRPLILEVGHDGLGAAGESMPLDLDFFRVHTSPAAAGTTAQDTVQVLTIPPGGGRMPATGLPVGAAAYVWVVAVDIDGNESLPSARVPGTPRKLVGDDMFNGAVGSAQLGSLVVKTVNIDNGAVNTLQIGEASVSILSAGIMNALAIIAGTWATDYAPNRRFAITGNGWQSFDSNNVLWAELNVNTRSMLVTGRTRTAPSGERMETESDGSARWFGVTGTDYASLQNENGQLRARSKADGSGRRSYVYFDPSQLRVTYESSTRTVFSELSFGQVFGTLRAPVLGMRVDQRFAPSDGTANRFFFVASSNGSPSGDIGESVLHYEAREGDGYAAIYGPGRSGLVWAGDGIAVIGGAPKAAYGAIVAASFDNPSSRKLKTDIVAARFGPHGSLTARDLVDRLPGVTWRYRDSDQQHVGPIAEDLHDLAPELIRTNSEGLLTLDVRDWSGVQGVALQQVSAAVHQLTARVEALEAA